MQGTESDLLEGTQPSLTLIDYLGSENTSSWPKEDRLATSAKYDG